LRTLGHHLSEALIVLLLPPPLATLVEVARAFVAGQADPDEVRQAMPAAWWFVWNGARLLDQLSPGVLRTGRVQELLRSARLESEAQWRALQALENALAEGRSVGVQRALEDLRLATDRLQEALRALRSEEQEADFFSPDPELDHFLKIGRNVLDGHVAAQALQADFPGVASRVARRRAAVARFALFHPDSGLGASAEPPLQNLEAGMGAAAEFLRGGRRETLEDCLRLVAPASVDLQPLLQEMEAWANRHRRHAAHPLVEELARAREVVLPGELLERLWEDLAALLEDEAARIETLRRHPLRVLAGLDPEPAAVLHLAARQALSESRSTGLAGAPLEALDAALTSLRRELACQAELLGQATAPVQGAPFLAELQLGLGRAMQGQLPREELHSVVEHFQALQQGLADELAQSAGLVDPEEEEALHDLLTRQGEAGTLLELWCQGAQGENLVEAWSILAETAPRLVALSESMRQRLQNASSTPSGTVCMRCGAANSPSSRYCGTCSAVLPVSAQGPTEFSEITGGGESAPAAPAHVVRLEDLVRRVEEEQAGPAEVQVEVEDLLARAEQVASTFHGQVRPRLLADPALVEYARFFEEQMEVYLEGLRAILCFAREGRSDLLYRGLESCRSAGVELMALRSVVDQADGP
jgi:hypothetical protein